ncbi:MAG: TMEM43 family protein [Bdellovibrionota bacterium]
MADSYTEYDNTGFLGRVGNSFKGVLFGAIFFLGSFALLGWNELRSVRQARSLEEGRSVVVNVDQASRNPQTEGKLVFTAGRAQTDETLTDSQFSVSASGLRLRRKVRMYQWDEDKDTHGSGSNKRTTYEYKKVWSENRINSSSFHYPSGHENPDSMPAATQELSSARAYVGAHRLSSGLIEQLSNYQPVQIGTGDVSRAPRLGSRTARLDSNSFYYGRDPRNPEIGDLQVDFSVVPPTDVSIVAKQVGETFGPYQTKAGNALEMLETGIHDSDYVFDAAQSRNSILTWILRGVGWLLMFFGLLMILGPIQALASFLPFVDSIVGLGMGLAAFALSVVLSATTVAVCWIAVRPLFGAGILAGAAFLFWAAKRKGDRRIQSGVLPANAPPPPPPPGAPMS